MENGKKAEEIMKSNKYGKQNFNQIFMKYITYDTTT